MRTSFVALITLAIGALSAAATDCSSNQFWYEAKGCCLDKGGPRSNDTPSPPRGRQCPSDWYWHSGKKCCVPRQHTAPPTPTCPPKCSWNRDDSSCHENGGSTTSNGPQPSYRPRSHKAKRATSLCPAGLQACSIDGARRDSMDFECTNPLEDLNACGGCVNTGKGVDCTTIANAWNVGCAVGVCQVYSCAPGYKVSIDGRSCNAL